MAHFCLHTSRDGRLAFVTVNGADDSELEMVRNFSLAEFGVPVLAFGAGQSFEVV